MDRHGKTQITDINIYIPSTLLYFILYPKQLHSVQQKSDFGCKPTLSKQTYQSGIESNYQNIFLFTFPIQVS